MTTELERDGGYEKVDAVGIVSFFVDTRYGADAYGNRGERRTIVDEVLDINVWDILCNELRITAKEEEYIAEQLTIKFLEG